MTGSFDASAMAAALQLARKGWYSARPNPRVGCVIARDQRIIGSGWHRKAGEAHAEVNALRQVGSAARGATAYVTLEPCNHQGRTGPCASALIQAGIAEVVYGMEDPHRLAAGGLDVLRQAGVVVRGPIMEQACRALNPGFIKRCETGLPRVRLKLAMSLDGRTAMASGESQWITGADARADVQRLRAESDAVMTGIGTVLADNPGLNVRAGDLHLADAGEIAAMQPLRVVLDSSQRLPRDARLLLPEGPVLVVTAGGTAWIAGAETIALPEYATMQNPAEQIPGEESPAEQIPENDHPENDHPVKEGSMGKGGDQERAVADRTGRVDLLASLRELGSRHCNDVLVEAGPTLAGAMLSRGLVDELVVYMAPKLMGNLARPLLTLPLAAMAEAVNLEITDIRAVGRDWRITAIPGAN